MQGQVRVDANKVVGQIHPHIYGHFIEHLRECIYNGLWAELLQNRKFAGHDTKHYGVIDPWLPVGSPDSAFWMHDNRVSYVPGMAEGRGQSQRIELKAAAYRRYRAAESRPDRRDEVRRPTRAEGRGSHRAGHRVARRGRDGRERHHRHRRSASGRPAA